MRLLALLTLLQLAPMFMGDTLQVYAMTQWKLQVSHLTMLYSVPDGWSVLPLVHHMTNNWSNSSQSCHGGGYASSTK